MDDQDDRRKIHFNPQFIARKAETRTSAKVHVNPAFFQKSRPSQGIPLQTCSPVKILDGNPALGSYESQQPHLHSHLNKMQVPMFSPVSSYTGSSLGSVHRQEGCLPGIMRTDFQKSASGSTFAHHHSIRSSYTAPPFTKPPSLVWKSGHSVSNQTHVSDVKLRSTEWPGKAVLPNPSRFKYQCTSKIVKDRLKTDCKPTDIMPNKYKVDNRSSVHLLKKDCLANYRKTCDINKNLNNTYNLVTSGRTVGLETVKNTKRSEVEKVLQRNCKDRDQIALRSSLRFPVSLRTANAKANKPSCSKVRGGLGSKVSEYEKSPSAPCSKDRGHISVPSVVSKKGAGDSCGKSDDSFATKEPKNSNVKVSNILINPVLLKSLSSNSGIDIVAIASKSSPQKSLRDSAPKDSSPVEQKSKEASGVLKLPSSLTSKYKVLSKTKLVRRRSRSFSKSKAKVSAKERPAEYVSLSSPPPLRRENSSITLCKPSPVFPTVPHSSITKFHPKKRYVVLSKNKLIRRLSGSFASHEHEQEKREKYSIKTKTKLVKRLPSSTPKSSKMINSLKVLRGRVDVECKRNYAVLSKTKLVKRKSNVGTHKHKVSNKEVKPNSIVIMQRHKLVRNAHAKYRKLVLPQTSSMKLVRRVKTKYKIENRGTGVSVKQKAARGIVSKYRINRLKVEASPIVKRSASGGRFTWVSSKGKTSDARLNLQPVKSQRLV